MQRVEARGYVRRLGRLAGGVRDQLQLGQRIRAARRRAHAQRRRTAPDRVSGVSGARRDPAPL